MHGLGLHRVSKSVLIQHGSPAMQQQQQQVL